jgi:hypothetical protein
MESPNSMIGQGKNHSENADEAFRAAAATCVRYHVLGLTFFMALLMYMKRGAMVPVRFCGQPD